MLAFIYLAYSMMALLYAKASPASFAGSYASIHLLGILYDGSAVRNCPSVREYVD